jgi:hypothetical protein
VTESIDSAMESIGSVMGGVGTDSRARSATVTGRRSRNRLIGLCAVTLVVNAVILLFVIPEFSNRLTSLYNQNLYPDGYDLIATSLVDGSGYRFYPDTARTMMREPGYPIFLAGIFYVFAKSLTAVKLVNMFLAVATAWVMTRIGRRLSSSQALIVVAPLMFLFHPGTLIAESRGGSEALFTLLFTLFALTLYRAIESRRGRDYVVSGGVLGLTVLVRSTPILFPLCLLVYLLVFECQGSPKRAAARNVALMVTAMFVVLSPWIVRNYSLTGKFVPTASVVGVSAYTGQYLCDHLAGHNYWVDEDLDREAGRERTKLAQELGYPFKDGYYQSFYASGDELKFSNYLLNRVIGRYKQSPMMFARCVRSNLFNLWFAGKTWTSTSMNLVVQLPYLILAVMGTMLSVRNKRFKLVAPLALLIVYYVAVYVPILAQARYSVPLIPFLSVLACLALAAARSKGAGVVSRVAQP